jgi:HD-like signal output (HDOD) protein
MWQRIRRLIWRDSAASAPAPADPRRAPAPARPESAGTPALALHADVPVSRQEPAIEDPTALLLAAWRDRLDRARRLLDAHPEAAQQPDAAALLQLLSEGPDLVVRQIPAAAREALTLVDDTSLSRSQLATRLGSDPALVQSLLRTANSAAFAAGRGEVLGIAQALERIGVTGTRAVVLASCVDGLLSHPGGEFNAMASEVWNHMVRTAPLARAIAPAFAADADEAFAVALLHDVGKLVVFDRISVLRASRRRPITVDATFAHELVQLLHEPLGALAVMRWGLGPRAASAIGNHHRSQVNPQRDSLAEVLCVAELADHAWRRNAPLDLDAIWQSGQLTGSPARVATALQTQLSAA